MMRDIFAAVSAAEAETKNNLDQSLQHIFGPEMQNTSKLLMDLMYTGELPIQDYISTVKVEDEMKFLDEIMQTFRIVTFVNLAINLTFIFLTFILWTNFCSIRNSFNDVKLLEMEIMRKS